MSFTDTDAPLADWARAYAQIGMPVFPVNPQTKAPMSEPASQKHATVELDVIAEWWETWPTALVGHRIDAGLIVTDIDPRHQGDATWRALKAEIGVLPNTRVHASGRGDGGAHFWWRHPGCRLNIRGLNEWARERNVGHAIALADGTPTGRWTSGIDLLHHDHRYTILPPSPHPDTGVASQMDYITKFIKQLYADRPDHTLGRPPTNPYLKLLESLSALKALDPIDTLDRITNRRDRDELHNQLIAGARKLMAIDQLLQGEQKLPQ